MSLKNFDSPPWTEQEYNILIHHYPEGGWGEVKGRLPHRSRNAVNQKARYLTLRFTGTNYRKFTAEERAIMHTYYPDEGSECRLRFKRHVTTNQIRGFARRHGLRTKRNHKYTEEENQIIQEHYPTNGVRYCIRAIKRQTGRDRTEGSIRKHASRLGVSHG